MKYYAVLMKLTMTVLNILMRPIVTLKKIAITQSDQ